MLAEAAVVLAADSEAEEEEAGNYIMKTIPDRDTSNLQTDKNHIY